MNNKDYIKMLKNCAHYPDQQGFCHECGVPMSIANSSEFYVICMDDENKINIKNKVFKNYADAMEYSMSIEKSRKPKVLTNTSNIT